MKQSERATHHASEAFEYQKALISVITAFIALLLVTTTWMMTSFDKLSVMKATSLGEYIAHNAQLLLPLMLATGVCLAYSTLATALGILYISSRLSLWELERETGHFESNSKASFFDTWARSMASSCVACLIGLPFWFANVMLFFLPRWIQGVPEKPFFAESGVHFLSLWWWLLLIGTILALSLEYIRWLILKKSQPPAADDEVEEVLELTDMETCEASITSASIGSEL